MFKPCFLAVSLLLSSALAHAQDYPSRPITLVVPYPAGGGTDVVARAMAEEMGKRLGQPVIVDNKPGAAGILGTNAVAKAPGDGYTVLLALTQSIITNQFLFAKLPYDPRKEFAFVSGVSGGQLVMAVHPSVPAKSVTEFLAWAARNKGKVSYGSWGVGSFPHLAGAYMSKSHELDMAHIAYKGEAPMVQDLVAGQLSWTIGSLATLRPFIEAGKLRVLAVAASEKRLSNMPEVPTMAEAGLPDPEYKVSGWVGMLVPASTPAPIVARLEKEARAAANATAVRARLQVLGFEPMGSSAEQFRKEHDAALPVWERLVKTSGAKLD